MVYKWLVRLELASLVLAASTLIVAPALADESVPEASREVAAQKRARLRTYHFGFALTTWASFGATSVVGTIRYANVIGFGTPLCEKGSPIFGRTYGCGDGLMIQHGISAGFTTLSYITTRTLAALMPLLDSRKGFAGFKGFKDFHDCEAAKKWSSRDPRRKEWSAMIAKIPMPLATYIAQVFKP